MLFSLAAQQMQAHMMQLHRMCTPAKFASRAVVHTPCACICLAVSCSGCCLQGCSSCKQSKACCKMAVVGMVLCMQRVAV